MSITIAELASILNGEIVGDKSINISGPSKIDEGLPGTISFLSNPKYELHIYNTKASAVLVSKSFVPKEKVMATLVKVDDVDKSLLYLMEQFGAKVTQEAVISSLSSIDIDTTVGKNVSIGDFTKVCKGVEIGDNTVLHDQVYVGKNVRVGSGCVIFPGVRLMSEVVIGNNCILHSNTVIGADGFGFSKGSDGVFKKIPQLGNVVIEDDVEIGGNCVIDRATMGSTILRKGVKFDNLVHIAHNVEIGKNTAVAGQTGIAGSTKIGKDCLIGGQVGIVGHIKVADGAQMQAKCGIAGNVKKKNAKLYGYPAIDYGDYLRSYAVFKQLPELLNKIRVMEKKIKK